MKSRSKASGYFQTKRQIGMLDALLGKHASVSDYANLIGALMDGVPIKAFTHRKADLLYRGRFNDAGRLFSHVREMSYPVASSSFSFPKGRFNEVDQSTLYAARCELGTMLELGPTFKRLFTIASIEPVTDNPLFMPLGILDREFSMAPNNKSEEMVRDFFYREATKEVVDSAREGYNCTIATGNHVMTTPVLSDGAYIVPSSRIGGIVYPSVKSRLLSNRTTYNYAIEPNFFDNHFRIKDATVYCLTNEGTSYILNDLNKGVCREDGTIEWKFDYDEMCQRIRSGLTFSGNRSTLLEQAVSLHAGM